MICEAIALLRKHLTRTVINWYLFVTVNVLQSLKLEIGHFFTGTNSI